VKTKALFAILLISLLLAACGSETVTDTPATTTSPATATSSTTVAQTTATAQTTTRPATPTTAIITAPPTVTPQPATTSAQNGYPGKIVYSTFDSDHMGEIFVINPDGSGKVKVADGSSPLFSPDGNRVAFLAPTGKKAAPPLDGISEVGIYSANLDGSDRQLFCTTDGNADLKLIRWSPRNRFIAMNATQNGPGGILTCNLATKKMGWLYSDKSGSASLAFDWTPDGDYALWQAGADYFDLDLYYGDPDKNGKDATRLTTGQNRPDNFGLKYYSAARFSPDGKTIAVAGNKIFFLSAPGQKSPLEGKTLENLNPYMLAWSPDGRALLVTNSNDKTIKIIDIATARTTTLATGTFLGDWSRK
jgi:WD40 repeat protein